MLSELDVLQNTVAWQSAFCTPPTKLHRWHHQITALITSACFIVHICCPMLALTRWTDKKERNNYRQTAINPSVASLVTTTLLPSWSCFGYASIRNQAKRLRRFAVKPPPCTNYVTICGEFLEFCFKSMKLWLNCESKQLMWNSVDADGSRFVSFAQLSQLIFILLQTAESKLIPLQFITVWMHQGYVEDYGWLLVAADLVLVF